MAGFTIDLAGRVRNFDLPKNQPLIPLYEAIVNSIYAIQERQQKEEFDGKIEVEIIRDPQQVAEIEGIDKSINEITGFRIIDNGVGLDDNNMKSFLQSDSTYRADKGGKGVGRFSWLKAFSKTHIESVYKDENDGVWVKREFEFSLDKLDIDDRLVEEKGAFENRTCVSLIDYLPTYRKHVNKNAETIAMKIMQHCMIYLMSPKCPQICVIDEERYSINNMAALAEYVAHRKVVLELLKKGINIKEDGKFNKEAYIHNLIYPMRRTSDEIEYSSHNLWLIDERLSYSEYISSDIPFDNNPKEERTDVMILDSPVAVSDEDNSGKEYETIVILELKRPMRDDYTYAENPVDQMLEYVEKLSSNKVSDKNGRIIRVGENTQFYLYAVCDITPSLKKVAFRNDFKETPDKMGLYKYHEKSHSYIEILSFDKILNDAEKRNRILFDKLGV